jgi:hypothetical protein
MTGRPRMRAGSVIVSSSAVLPLLYSFALNLYIFEHQHHHHQHSSILNDFTIIYLHTQKKNTVLESNKIRKKKEVFIYI